MPLWRCDSTLIRVVSEPKPTFFSPFLSVSRSCFRQFGSSGLRIWQLAGRENPRPTCPGKLSHGAEAHGPRCLGRIPVALALASGRTVAETASLAPVGRADLGRVAGRGRCLPPPRGRPAGGFPDSSVPYSRSNLTGLSHTGCRLDTSSRKQKRFWPIGSATNNLARGLPC